MATESLEGWLLQKTPSGDTSLNLSFLTREKGLVRALYKGGRNPKKQALLQPFTPLWVELNQRRDWFYVQKVEPLSLSLFLTGKNLFAALYLNELLFYSLASLEVHLTLFEIYVATLRNIADAKDKYTLELSLRFFEKELLVALGEGISFELEAGLVVPIEGDYFYQYLPGIGFKKSNNGILGTDILKLNNGELDNPRILKLAKIIMRKAIDNLLGGRELKSRALASSHLALLEQK